MKRKWAGRSVASTAARRLLTKMLLTKIERVVINALEFVATS
jgi:hypothetical protein